ncbi:hypothetical protein D3C87_1676520 [compost metagenome]
MTGGDGRDLGDPGIVINTRRRNAGPGVPVADHASHTAVDQTLSYGHGGARIGLIIFGLQFERHCFAADGRVLFVDVVDRQLCAVLQIFADSRRRAGERACQADNYRFTVRSP